MSSTDESVTLTDLSASLIKDGWFSEAEALWPGQKLSLQVDKVLHCEHSGLQDVLIFDSTTYGRVLVLDGVIQLTERDEFAYQEMITHLPIMAHPRPRSVLIVGGGDGGVLREVVRHPEIEKIVMCDIDKCVVDLAREYFARSTATAFGDPRVELLHMDAAKYVEEHEEAFDVVIIDSTDPVGPAETLFAPEFHLALKRGLRDGGVFCAQGECMWLHLGLIKGVLDSTKTLFPTVDYAYTTIPTYPSGQIGFILASKDSELDLKRPSRKLSADLQADLRYYSPEMHAASFVLPPFVKRAFTKGPVVAEEVARSEE